MALAGSLPPSLEEALRSAAPARIYLGSDHSHYPVSISLPAPLPAPYPAASTAHTCPSPGAAGAKYHRDKTGGYDILSTPLMTGQGPVLHERRTVSGQLARGPEEIAYDRMTTHV